MAILYLVSVISLWVGILLFRKGQKKQNLVVWCICSAMLDLCVQAMLAGIIGKLGLPVSCASIGIANLAVSLGLGLWIAKRGIQEYEIRIPDVISVLIILGMIMVFAFSKFGKNLDTISFISVDPSVHCRNAQQVALEHTLGTNLFFAAVPVGLLMQVYSELTGGIMFNLYRVFIFGEVVYTTLAALLFWALLCERCGEGKWKRFIPVLITPFYWAGYPLYTTLFGFSYLGTAVSLINLELILLDQLLRKKTDRIVCILGLNLALFGVFVSYTLFVPTAFFGAFIAVAFEMREKAGGKLSRMISWKNLLTMLAIFLVPSALGLLYSIGDIQYAAPGGGIAQEGGCYNDMYSSFILPLPFVLIGLYCLTKKKEGRFMLPMMAVHLLIMAVMVAGYMTKTVSVYYYVKNNNILWLIVWVLVTEAVWGMMERTKWAALMPLFFYSVLFMGKYVDPWLMNVKNIATRVKVWSYVDLILVNNTYFNHTPDVSRNTVELYRFADEHFDQSEVMSVNFELQNGWYMTLTGGKNVYTYGSYEKFLKELEEKKIKYIVGGYSGTYTAFSPYLETLEVIWENDSGKVFRLPEGARPTLDAPPLPPPEEEEPSS